MVSQSEASGLCDTNAVNMVHDWILYDRVAFIHQKTESMFLMFI